MSKEALIKCDHDNVICLFIKVERRVLLVFEYQKSIDEFATKAHHMHVERNVNEK